MRNSFDLGSYGDVVFRRVNSFTPPVQGIIPLVVTGDSVVDTADFRLLLANYGRRFGGSLKVGAAEARALAAFESRVPEPQSIVLALMGLGALRRRRRRDGL